MNEMEIYCCSCGKNSKQSLMFWLIMDVSCRVGDFSVIIR